MDHLAWRGLLDLGSDSGLMMVVWVQVEVKGDAVELMMVTMMMNWGYSIEVHSCLEEIHAPDRMENESSKMKAMGSTCCRVRVDCM